MTRKNEINLEIVKEKDYLEKTMIYNAIQLNEHLAEELSSLQEERKSKITNRVINLAIATAVISDLAFLNLPDADTVIQYRVSH